MAKSLFDEWHGERGGCEAFRPAGQTVTPIFLHQTICGAPEKDVSPAFSAIQLRIGFGAFNGTVRKGTAREDPLAIVLSLKGSVGSLSPFREITGRHFKILGQALEELPALPGSTLLLERYSVSRGSK
jgi:hypothetical protein